MINAEKLIEGLKKTCWGKSAHVIDDERRKAALVLSVLRDENEKLRAELEQKSKLISQRAQKFTPLNEPLTPELLKEMVRKAGRPVVVWTIGLDEAGDLDPDTGEWQMFDGDYFSGPNTIDDLSNYGPRPHGYFVAYLNQPEPST